MPRKNATTPTPTEPPTSSPPAARALNFLLRFRRFWWDAAGVLTLTGALLILLAHLQLTDGALLTPLVTLLQRAFGWGIFIIVVGLGVLGLLMLRRRTTETALLNWARVTALEVAAAAALVLLALAGGQSLARADQGLDGGWVGWGLAEFFTLLMPPLVAALLMVVLLFLGIAIGTGLMATLRREALASLKRAAAAGESAPVGMPRTPEERATPQAPASPALGAAAPAAKPRVPLIPPQFRKNFSIPKPEAERPADAPPRDTRLPPLTLLAEERATRPDERHINQTAGLIEKTLAEFGIPARVVGFQVGPTVTQFAVEPGFVEKEKGSAEEEAVRQKVRVSQISALQRDLTLALSATRLRIEAPVPGRPYVGIEVPNRASAMVRLRPLMESEPFAKAESPLTVALGRDVSGKPVIADLARMPHLLIAGTTGSGKSVCIAALATCLVANNTPEDLRLVMIDPKMVELVRFNGLPHLFGKVETDLERILGVLRWTVAEMERRYKLLEQSHSRNLESHNKKVARKPDAKPLPRLVVFLDELADLMMAAPDQTEHTLVRLAQMARATGIHLVVATQRPSTDVVTGLIKANFPARLAFTVASSIDSRVILDTPGAETLLGRGDMLFLPPDAGAPLRAQGVMVDDAEVEKVLNFWRQAGTPTAAETPPWEDLIAQQTADADRDDLVQQAIAVVRETKRANASLLQRRLKIGYPRAARLMDELEELGILVPSENGREREVVLDELQADEER
ncbi:MAG: hypothetical protein OHK0052_14780 [Anaerolineales bacterium]